MTFQTKRKVDYWLGGMLLAALFVPVRLLGFLLKRDHTVTHRGLRCHQNGRCGQLVPGNAVDAGDPEKFRLGGSFLSARLVGHQSGSRIGWFDEYWTIDDSSRCDWLDPPSWRCGGWDGAPIT